ncbi:MAG: DoxX family protein [Xanthomonadales bacterium]|nr:DoxX family protein [Xanthomonadales bacterium]
MHTIQSFAAPAGRLLLSVIFLLAGYNKIGGYAGTQGYMESFGVPGALLPLVIALEILGALALIAGWHARLTAFLLAGFTLLSALIFHTNFGEQTQFLFFLKNLAITGGLLMIVAQGPGPYALDTRRDQA